MLFRDVLAKYRDESFSQRDKGTRFERLMRGFLLTDPKYQPRLKEVCLWEDFFARDQLGSIDTGIDLVAETVDGEYWAIQCKCYDERSSIQADEVSKFIAASGRSFIDKKGNKTQFTLRLWISTTDNWSVNAENTIIGQTPPVTRINLSELDSSPVDWKKLEDGIHGKAARIKKYNMLPHQKEAFDNARNYFETKDRGKLIMACGTGKTYTSLKIAESEANKSRLVLFLAPSIALVGQTLREWTSQSENDLNILCVCSDPKVSQTRDKNDELGERTIDLGIPATTDSDRLLDSYKQFKNNNITVIFSTYQSIDVITNAQKRGLPEFDLIVCDEAHRTTGAFKEDDESSFVKVHDNSFVKGKKRMYMTATPRLYTEESKVRASRDSVILCSMDDAKLYGEEIYHIGFGKAVEKGLLTDYKVLILTISDKDIPAAFQKVIANDQDEIPADYKLKLVGCISALSKQIWGDNTVLKADPGYMKKAVAFCQDIKTSKRITKWFNEYASVYKESLTDDQRRRIANVSADHVDGSMNTPARDKLMAWLKNEDKDDECNVLNNVRCLSEGVDVPALDAVMFLATKNSPIDVVQSVGRVMRTSKDKKFGYIIIPVVVPSTVDPSTALDSNKQYAVIWSVLNALRAHDDRFSALINKIDLNKNRPGQIVIGGPISGEGGGSGEGTQTTFPIEITELQDIMYARLVQKVGERTYWEDWANSVGELAKKQVDSISKIVKKEECRPAFDKFISGLKQNINSSITEQSAIEMLSQHIITAPVFNALFDGYKFAENNPISQAMDNLLAQIRMYNSVINDTKELEGFYESVRKRAEGIDNAEGRQRIVIELYNNFFKAAFPKMAEQLGIVYTPVEVVDFIINSVNDVLQKEFGRSIKDKNVNVLDPFTGTGTFITRLLQSGLIDKENLPRKYAEELFANEIVLLAYYIAAVNIENEYHEVMGKDEYVPFNGICLTDTFQTMEKTGQSTFDKTFEKNLSRISRMKNTPITVILGNPPYSMGQRSANDDAKNNSYPALDKRIKDTYVSESDAVNNMSLYDSYIRAFRYAADRIGDDDGIICYVSNGGWLDGNSAMGFRKIIEQEFAKIFVFNLRGNQRTSGELSRKEGGKIFGSGSRTPVAITLLVKRKGFKGKTEISYHDIGDYLSREEKLEIIRKFESFLSPKMKVDILNLKESGYWLSNRNDDFKRFEPLAGDTHKKFDKHVEETVFVGYSRGYMTCRDAWVYNFSKESLQKNVKNMIDFFNNQSIENVDYNKTKISWTGELLYKLKKKYKVEFEVDKMSLAMYRPFTKEAFYYGNDLIERRYQNEKLFPVPGIKNLLICVSGTGSATENFSCLMTDRNADVSILGATQCFPLYWYEFDSRTKNITIQNTLFKNDYEVGEKITRHDGIGNSFFSRVRNKYDNNKITKEEIFYYVYGILHSQEYRENFADDLKMSLPRIPLVKSYEDFVDFSNAGRELAELHINYESEPPYADAVIVGNKSDFVINDELRFLKKDRKDVIRFNEKAIVENIPDKAYEYVVNGRSAIEWIMDRYKNSVDKDSQIRNNANLYGEEIGQPDYVLNLLLSIISVSIKTVDIVNGLPKLGYDLYDDSDDKVRVQKSLDV